MTGPQPPIDCLAQQAHCVSVAGTRNGESLAFSCRMAGIGDVTKSGNQWAIHCVDSAQDLSFRVAFPAPAAAFNHQVPPAVGDLEFHFSSFNLATTAKKGEMNETSTNLMRATVTGSVDAQKVVAGSFHGEWGPPPAGCKSDIGAPCAAGVVNARFRVQFF
jgi:hypothetical protein